MKHKSCGLFSSDQFGVSIALVGKFFSEETRIITNYSKKSPSPLVPNLKESTNLDATVTRSRNVKRGAITKSGSFEEIKKSVDFTRFLIPSMTVGIVQQGGNKEIRSEFRDQAKSKQNDYVGRGKTSYRMRSSFLVIENNITGNLVFNRTHRLLMFGAFGSIADKISDDEDEQTKKELGTRFNPTGLTMDELADVDNSTDYDIDTMCKFPGQYSPNQKNTAFLFRSRFYMKLHEKVETFKSIRMIEKLDLHSSVQLPDTSFRSLQEKNEKIEFKELDFVDFQLMLLIFPLIYGPNSSFIDNADIDSLLQTVDYILRTAIAKPNAQVHLVCTRVVLRFLYITNILFYDLIDGLKNCPNSLFEFITDLLEKELVYNNNTFVDEEAQLIAKQIAAGGLYCHEIFEYNNLAFAARMENFLTTAYYECQIIRNNDISATKLSNLVIINGGEQDLFKVRIEFCDKRSFVIKAEPLEGLSVPPPLMPINNMFDISNKYASETGEIVVLPW